MKTYVEFLIPHKKIPAGTIEIRQVETRDIGALEFPRGAVRFHFFDSPVDEVLPADAIDDKHNVSPTYVIADKVMSAQALRAQREKDPDFLRRAGDTSLPPGRKISNGAIFRAVHDMVLSKHAYHAVRANGQTVPLGRGDIVINRKKQLVPYGGNASTSFNHPSRPKKPERLRLLPRIRLRRPD